MSHRLVWSHLSAICVAVIAVFSLPASAQDACDRACLTRAADAWFAAIAAHDPAKAPIAPNARFTEQTQARQIGEGLWKTASEAPTTFKIYVADPVAGQIGGRCLCALGDFAVSSVAGTYRHFADAFKATVNGNR